ncbi:unnamed protein product [Effrenium voratum]|nr:unnamed protein product [Effrenium voratum]
MGFGMASDSTTATWEEGSPLEPLELSRVPEESTGSASLPHRQSSCNSARRSFHSWNSFQNSYELVGIGEDLDRRCLHNHLLHQMEAVKSHRFVCDFCRHAISKGDKFWSCPRCVWDVCEACYEKGARFKEGDLLELVHQLENYPRGTVGTIKEVVNDEEGRHKALKVVIVPLDPAEDPPEETLMPQDFKKIKVLDAPKTDVRMMVGILLITALFMYGILDHRRLNTLLKRFVDWCKTLGMWSSVMLFLVSSILPVIMLPVFPIMALSGPLFTEMNDGEAFVGGTVAFAVVFSGLWVGSVTAFALGKSLLHDYARRASKGSRVLRRLNRIIDKAGIKIVFMARSLPILPAEVFDYACAMTTLAVHEYAIGCLGSAVPVAFWTYSTAQAANLARPERSPPTTHLALILLNIGCLVVLTLVLVHVIQSHEQDSTDEFVEVEWHENMKDPKAEVVRALQTQSLQLSREGRDFTIRDKSNKLLQVWDEQGFIPRLSRKWECRAELTPENFPLKIHIHKDEPLVNDLLEPVVSVVQKARKRLSSKIIYRELATTDQSLTMP